MMGVGRSNPPRPGQAQPELEGPSEESPSGNSKQRPVTEDPRIHKIPGRVQKEGLPGRVSSLTSRDEARKGQLLQSHSMNDINKIDCREMRPQTESPASLPPALIRREELMELINSHDVNALNKEGNAVIHALLKENRKDKLEILMVLLINSKVDVNCQNSTGDTALHIAIRNKEVKCVKALVVFGADINMCNSNGFAPYDLVIKINTSDLLNVEGLLIKLGAKRSSELLHETTINRVPSMHSLAENVYRLKEHVKFNPNDKLSDFINKYGTRQLHRELQNFVNAEKEMDLYIVSEQQKELAQYNRTQQLGGSRILFLDGGGIKGLIQLEILMQIEEATGRSVVELFDWIVGTSTGGVIALALVYGKKSLSDLRQLYFKLKGRVFQAKRHYGFGFDSDALDEILQEYLDPDVELTAVSHPKVLISAVNKLTTNLKLHFFNNCFDDEYSKHHVWKVARYTSAAPLYFIEVDNYVDGGLICNNPTEHGLTAIQNFCRKQGIDLPISVVVSVGSGQNPEQPTGAVDAQEALSFGKQWLRPDKLINVTQNLFQLLTNALLESELMTINSECRCRGLNIPFFRFSPKLNEIITAAETDNDKLLNMVIKTKLDMKSWHKHNRKLVELTQLFHQIANQQRKVKAEFPHTEPLSPKSQPATVFSKELSPTLDSWSEGVEHSCTSPLTESTTTTDQQVHSIEIEQSQAFTVIIK